MDARNLADTSILATVRPRQPPFGWVFTFSKIIIIKKGKKKNPKKTPKKRCKSRKLAMRMFQTSASEPDGDFCLDYKNIQLCLLLRKDYPRGKEENWLRNRRTERKHESGCVIQATSGESAAGLRKQTDAGGGFSHGPESHEGAGRGSLPG